MGYSYHKKNLNAGEMVPKICDADITISQSENLQTSCSL